jgi:hypothetical protein
MLLTSPSAAPTCKALQCSKGQQHANGGSEDASHAGAQEQHRADGVRDAPPKAVSLRIENTLAVTCIVPSKLHWPSLAEWLQEEASGITKDSRLPPTTVSIYSTISDALQLKP